MNNIEEGADPLVYGYLCVEGADDAQLSTWRAEIAAYCTAFSYRLGSIFIDRGAATDSFTRGGFVELLAALRLPDAFGVVVPSLAQLSAETFVQQALVQMVHLTNSQLLVAQHVNGSNPELSLPDGSGADS